MRQWLVDTKLMCDRHLLGEHVEHHMIVGAMKRRKSLDGYFRKGLIFPSTLVTRHNGIASEMRRRGFKHESDLELPFDASVLLSYVERERELRPLQFVSHRVDLVQRCDTCKALFEGAASVRV